MTVVKWSRQGLSVLLLGVLATSILVNADSCSTSSCPTSKCYLRRSDSRHKDRILVGQIGYTDRHDADAWYGHLSVNPGYSKTFKSDKIARCLFGADIQGDDCLEIKVQGSRHADRDPKAWLADNFYLPREYNGSFTIDPKIKTFHLDIDGYLGFDEWCKGLYARVYGTVVNTKWHLNFCDKPDPTDFEATYDDHDPGYFSPRQYAVENLVQSFGDYAKGEIPTPFTGDTDDRVRQTNDNIVFKPLNFARITNCERKETGFADLRFELGWNFLQCDDYHLGLNLQFAAPTGSRKEACFLFDAQVGNGDHWELGGGLAGHYNCWTSENGQDSFGFWFDLSVTHLFDKCQRRTFDLKNKPNSAYMLAAKFGANPHTGPDPAIAADAGTLTGVGVLPFTAGPLRTGLGTPIDQVGTGAASPTAVANTDATATTQQFAFEYTPVANLSTVRVDVSASVQADLVAMVNYRCGCFSWDLGYNFWARSCEDIDCPKNCKDGSICDSSQKDTWALKGDARMFGYQALTADRVTTSGPTLSPTVNAYPLSATQSGATLRTGTNDVAINSVVPSATAPGADINLNVDNSAFAFVTEQDIAPGDFGPLGLAPFLVTTGTTADVFNAGAAIGDWHDLNTGSRQIKTSSTPVFLSCNSLDLARMRGLSHKIFTHLGWHWDQMDDACWAPYIGIGASAEFGSNDDCCESTTTTTTTTTVCKSCVDCSVSQWSVWVKGGLAFN